MTQTLTTLLASTRSLLNEPTARLWSDSEITTWLNEACRDLARRTEDLQVFDTSITAGPGTRAYALPAAIHRLHRVEFAPSGSTLVYPLKPSSFDEMDPVMGINPALQSSYPYYWFLWGYPPTLTLYVYPVPAQAGVFNLFFYKPPTAMVSGSDLADVPNGWEDLLVTYAEYRARRKNRDPIWSDVKAEYEEKLAEMIDVTRQWHDQARHIITESGLGIPSWLYEPSWE